VACVGCLVPFVNGRRNRVEQSAGGKQQATGRWRDIDFSGRSRCCCSRHSRPCCCTAKVEQCVTSVKIASETKTTGGCVVIDLLDPSSSTFFFWPTPIFAFSPRHRVAARRSEQPPGSLAPRRKTLKWPFCCEPLCPPDEKLCDGN
jgi:hypothetical protein